MNSQRLEETLISAVSETIENMAFVEAVHCSSEHCLPQAEGAERRAVLKVFKPVNGLLYMVMPGQLLETVTENIYGEEPGGGPADTAGDTMSEILNTIAGRLMNHVTDPDQQFELGLPALDEVPVENERNSTLTCIFDIDGERFSVSFTIEI